ncbi:Hypothetical predicted protein [Mytilus galloprovincialis]|uniref:Uncharacterized protein n=2 Tax=Mytilus galloprovincialis TaxID=29158 RepID=A0A8B6DH87_MYTGA|nr:Hypothetical predicted protein [Mytilus galloprovincialis]
MLGQLLQLSKTVLRRLHAKNQTENSGWIDYNNGYMETCKMDIENCELCDERKSKVKDHSELKHVKEESWTFQKLWNIECLKLIVSLATLLINFIVVTLMLCDLKLLESKMYSKSEMQKYQHNTKSDFCINFPKGTNKQRELNSWTFHCLKNSQYLRHLFDMMTLSSKRRLVPHSDNINVQQRTVFHKYIQGQSSSKNENAECPKLSGLVKLRSLLTNRNSNTNELTIQTSGLYMIYVHAEFRSLDRCSKSRNEVNIQEKGHLIVSDSIGHKAGPLVCQPTVYSVFVKLKESSSLSVNIPDTSFLESHWKSNMIGGVLVS